MQPFKSHRGLIATLDRANVDTDQIIPKQFLKSIKRTGFGESLFFDWRYLANGKPNPDFELNRPEFKGAAILVTRNNFGCGSSREHAVWAIQQYGFRAVLAPWQEQSGTQDDKPVQSLRKEMGTAPVEFRRGGRHTPAFADIFRSNCGKNGVLAVELAEPEVEEIFRIVARFTGLEATIDLEHQRVTLHLDEEISFHFEIDNAVKDHLIHGLDDIGITLKEEAAVSAFESRHNLQIKFSENGGKK